MRTYKEKSFKIMYDIKVDVSKNERKDTLNILFYLNGRKIHTMRDFRNLESFKLLKKWLEDIVLGKSNETFSFYSPINGERVSLQCDIVTSNISNITNEKTVITLITNKKFHFEYQTKQFIYQMYRSYMAVSRYFLFTNRKKGIGKFIDFYNQCKSSIIEQFIYKELDDDTVNTQIKDIVTFWTEYGDCCFWGAYGAYGGPDSIYVYNGEEIPLKHIKGLRDWYDIFDSLTFAFGDQDEDDEDYISFDDWFEKGLFYAKEIRKLLPSEVDFYYEGAGSNVPEKYKKECFIIIDGSEQCSIYIPKLKE